MGATIGRLAHTLISSPHCHCTITWLLCRSKRLDRRAVPRGFDTWMPTTGLTCVLWFGAACVPSRQSETDLDPWRGWLAPYRRQRRTWSPLYFNKVPLSSHNIICARACTAPWARRAFFSAVHRRSAIINRDSLDILSKKSCLYFTCTKQSISLLFN